MAALINYENFNTGDLPVFPEDSETKGALEVLQWANDHYGNKLIYACSFGIEGIVLTDLLAKVNPSAKIVFLDTDVHFEETYQLIDQVKSDIQIFQSK